jgi:hypothetical protein
MNQQATILTPALFLIMVIGLSMVAMFGQAAHNLNFSFIKLPQTQLVQ